MSQPFMQLYVADYLGDTQHLTAEEHGAYLLLLMTLWRQGGYLPNDPGKLARIARVSPARWGRVAATIMPFLEVTDDGRVTQKRLLMELEKACHKSRSRATAGAAGGAAKALKTQQQALANATVLPPVLPQHLSDIRYQISDRVEDSSTSSVPTTNSEPAASRSRARRRGYAFEGAVVRITEADYDRWRKAYSAIPDLRAELTQADDFYAGSPPKDGKLFFAVSSWLKRANDRALEKAREETGRSTKVPAGAIDVTRAADGTVLGYRTVAL